MAHAAAGPAHERVPMAEDRPHGADLVGGPEAAAQQADGVEILQPLAVLHVGLAAGQVFAVARVDEADVQPRRLEDLEERDPIDAGGLHRDGGDATFLEPVAHGVQVLGEGGEGTHRAGARSGRNRDVDFARAEVNAGGVRMMERWWRSGGFCFWRIAFVTRGHRMPLVDG